MDFEYSLMEVAKRLRDVSVTSRFELGAAAWRPLVSEYRPRSALLRLEVHLGDFAGRVPAHDDVEEDLIGWRLEEAGSYRNATSMPRTSSVSAWTMS